MTIKTAAYTVVATPTTARRFPPGCGRASHVRRSPPPRSPVVSLLGRRSAELRIDEQHGDDRAAFHRRAEQRGRVHHRRRGWRGCGDRMCQGWAVERARFTSTPGQRYSPLRVFFHDALSEPYSRGGHCLRAGYSGGVVRCLICGLRRVPASFPARSSPLLWRIYPWGHTPPTGARISTRRQSCEENDPNKATLLVRGRHAAARRVGTTG